MVMVARMRIQTKILMMITTESWMNSMLVLEVKLDGYHHRTRIVMQTDAVTIMRTMIMTMIA